MRSRSCSEFSLLFYLDVNKSALSDKFIRYYMCLRTEKVTVEDDNQHVPVFQTKITNGVSKEVAKDSDGIDNPGLVPSLSQVFRYYTFICRIK